MFSLTATLVILLAGSTASEIITGRDTLKFGDGIQFEKGLVHDVVGETGSMSLTCDVSVVEADLVLGMGVSCLALGCCTPGYLSSPRPFYKSKAPLATVDLSVSIDTSDTLLFRRLDTAGMHDQCLLPRTATFAGEPGADETTLPDTGCFYLCLTANNRCVLWRVVGILRGSLDAFDPNNDVYQCMWALVMEWQLQTDGSTRFEEELAADVSSSQRRPSKALFGVRTEGHPVVDVLGRIVDRPMKLGNPDRNVRIVLRSMVPVVHLP